MEVARPGDGHLLTCEECCHHASKVIEFSMTVDYKPYTYWVCISCLKDAIEMLNEELRT